jgi:hypothetical protein
MIQFDRIENDRIYLGFTSTELDEILTLLEKNQPDSEITNRLDVLGMVFTRDKHDKNKEG